MPDSNDPFDTSAASQSAGGQQPRVTLDQFSTNSTSPTNNAINSQPTGATAPAEAPAKQPSNPEPMAATNIAGLSSLETSDDSNSNPLDSTPIPTPASSTIPQNTLFGSTDKPAKKKGFFGLSRKSKTAEQTQPTTPLFSASNQEFSDNSDIAPANPIDINSALGADPANPADSSITNDSVPVTEQLDTLTTPSTEPETTNPIADSLSTAANLADQNKSPVEIGSSQPKQITISMLTIIFGLLFVVSTSLAIWLMISKNSVNSQLNDATAELQSIKDKNNSKANKANKTTTQFDSLQNKIKELTKSNETKQKVLDENKKSIDDLTKRNTDLNNQLKSAQDKLASDKQVSDSMKSLVITLCDSNDNIKKSSTCVDAAAANSEHN